MYIPKEVIWFTLGFIAFPIVCYALVEIVENRKKKEKEEQDFINAPIDYLKEKDKEDEDKVE